VEPYGLVILIVLLVTGLLGKLLVPPLMLAQGLLYKFVGVNPGGLF
jgi:hypothetical protein